MKRTKPPLRQTDGSPIQKFLHTLAVDTNLATDILKKDKREKRVGGTREKHAAQDATREKCAAQCAIEHTKHAAEHVDDTKFRIIIIF